MVRARVAVLDDPPGRPNPLHNEVVWVHEGWLVRHIGYRMQPREGLVKHVDLRALIEDRVLRQARPVRMNLVAVLLVELRVEQILQHMFVARWRRLAGHSLGCMVVDPRAIAQQGLV